jgi:hypothetical protein
MNQYVNWWEEYITAQNLPSGLTKDMITAFDPNYPTKTKIALLQAMGPAIIMILTLDRFDNEVFGHTLKPGSNIIGATKKGTCLIALKGMATTTTMEIKMENLFSFAKGRSKKPPPLATFLCLAKNTVNETTLTAGDNIVDVRKFTILPPLLSQIFACLSQDDQKDPWTIMRSLINIFFHFAKTGEELSPPQMMIMNYSYHQY